MGQPWECMSHVSAFKIALCSPTNFLTLRLPSNLRHVYVSVLNLCILYVQHLNRRNAQNLSAVLRDRYSIPYLRFPLLRDGCALYASTGSSEYRWLVQP